MRTWFWTLLLAAAAVALAVLVRDHAGNVVLLVPPWRVELSLALTVLLLVGLFVILYVGLRLLAWLLAIPHRWRTWRGRRAMIKDHVLLERGWIELLEGRYVQAENDLHKLLQQTRETPRKVLAAVSAARAAHDLGEYARRDGLLEQARTHAQDTEALRNAVAAISADMLLEQGEPERALAQLEPLQDGATRHMHITRLLLRAHHALGHHEQTLTLARSLARRKIIARAEADALIETAAAGLLQASGEEGWRAVWKRLKSEERLLPQVALQAAAAFDAAGEPDEARRVLEAAIGARFDNALVEAYARCVPEQVARRLEKAENWLQQRPKDPQLLRALGVLCLNGQLWGPAQRYLSRSLSLDNDARTHALLGGLFDRLDRPADAVRHWRTATAVTVGLPVLITEAALPPADTEGDPALLDAEGLVELEPDAGGLVSPTAQPDSAADLVLDPPARSYDPRTDAQVSVREEQDIEDYFDSAPPAAALMPDVHPAARPDAIVPAPAAEDTDLNPDSTAPDAVPAARPGSAP